MKGFIRNLVMGRPWSQGLFERMLRTSLAGLNAIGVGAGPRKSGETWAIRYALSKSGENPTVFDAGAQGGDYIAVVLETNPESRIYAFEPAQNAYDQLKKKEYPHTFLFKAALGKEEGDRELYSAEGVSGVDSLYKLPDTTHNTFRPSGKVPVCTVDSFCRQQGIPHIDLLKLDIEGGEFDALQGAREMIGRRDIRFIQFEHSSHAVDAGYKFKDVFNLLAPQYRVYRILLEGLWEIQAPTPLQEFPFAVNYLAELR